MAAGGIVRAGGVVNERAAANSSVAATAGGVVECLPAHGGVIRAGDIFQGVRPSRGVGVGVARGRVPRLLCSGHRRPQAGCRSDHAQRPAQS